MNKILYSFLFLICSSSFSYVQENFIFQLTQSSSDLIIWTTCPSKHVFKDSPIPLEKGNYIQLYLSKYEYEPLQIILNSKISKTVKIEMKNANIDGLSYEFFYVDYVPITKITDNGIGSQLGDTPDPIIPANFGSFNLEANQNAPLWILFNASKNIISGNYSYTLSIDSIQIPIYVKVFNFQMSEDLHFYSQMNVNHEIVLQKYGIVGVDANYWPFVEKFKNWMIQHRITPGGPLWSGGLTSKGCPYITWDKTTKKWSDKDGIWGFEANAKKYILGEGFNNGHGWPHFSVMGLKTV